MNQVLFPAVFVLLILCALVFPPALDADQIVMKNGDIISGKVTRVDDKEVTIKPAYTKKFAVKRSAVASIETESILEVELMNGEVVHARFAGLEEGMQVLEVEERPTPIDINDMNKAGVPQQWYARESHAEALLTINEGNTTSRSSAFLMDTRVRLGDHRQYAALAFRRDENNGQTTKKQNGATYEYDWLFRPSWYLGATANYERDPIRDLNHRFTFGALMGHDFLDSGHNFLTIKAGLGYTDENLGDVPTSGLTGLWEFKFRHQFKRSKLEFLHDHSVSYQNYGNNNTIIRSNTGLRVDILWDIYATATYRFNYESEPAPGKFEKDSTLAFGLGAKF
ncbi:MAG: DUF481 domain-containing protein [Xanthomonadales bacterium]|jgi:putative salt-induced outer membrane protein YdiY|nr:DUF481 domain-containing protein [Xanthomonadales bacterium]